MWCLKVLSKLLVSLSLSLDTRDVKCRPSSYPVGAYSLIKKRGDIAKQSEAKTSYHTILADINATWGVNTVIL